ncbi:hypothetical protein CASFOL_039933 [Castilleja foliolosa]|uniref:P-type ATPase C-terminal domain-containing protein n=1 Tax=Castilleja foliolosa TaxID=1961234 RepID=A0ABD3BGM4_9LAMI
MASDFYIAQFRFLERLLVVHGHWCCKGIAQMGSAWRRSHSMVWPSDLWPSSRVRWKTLAAQMMRIRMRRPYILLTQVAAGILIDIMPGANDPANFSMPQQSCTNPHSFELDNVRYVDLALQSDQTPPSTTIHENKATSCDGKWLLGSRWSGFLLGLPRRLNTRIVGKLSVVKYFLDSKTFQKVKFVYPKKEDSVELMRTYFDVENLPTEFGGKATLQYDHEEFSRQMAQDDVKSAKLWGLDKHQSNGFAGAGVAPEPDSLITPVS